MIPERYSYNGILYEVVYDLLTGATVNYTHFKGRPLFHVEYFGNRFYNPLSLLCFNAGF